MSDNIWVSAKDALGRTFTVGGKDYEEFSGNLIAIFGPQGADRIVEDFGIIADPPTLAQPSQPAAPSAPASSAPAAPAAPGAPSCAHGARTFRSGQGKKGPWSAWFCPLPSDRKAEQCEAIWG